MELVSTFEALVREVSWVMTRPTFASFLIVVAGWLFARRRTVTGMIQAAGAVGAKHHSAFHRVFAAARWSLDDVGLAVFGLALRLLDPAATIFVAVDDTLARKRGMKVFGVGMHYDPMLSSRGKAIVNWGHSWVNYESVKHYVIKLFKILLKIRGTAKKQSLLDRVKASLIMVIFHRSALDKVV